MFNTKNNLSEISKANTNETNSFLTENKPEISIPSSTSFDLVEEDNTFDNIISHNLAHAILDREPDKFLYIYDKIPSEFSQLRVSFLIRLLSPKSYFDRSQLV